MLGYIRYFLLIVFVFLSVYLAVKLAKLSKARKQIGRKYSKFTKKDVLSVSKSMERKGFSQETYTSNRLDSAYGTLVPRGGFVTARSLQQQFDSQDFSQEQVRHIIPEYLLKNVFNAVLKANTTGNLDALESFVYSLNDSNLARLWDQARGKLEFKNGRQWFQLIGKQLVKELRKQLSNSNRNLFSDDKNTNQFVNSFIDLPSDLFQRSPRLLQNILSSFVHAMEAVGLQPHLQVIDGIPLIGGTGSLAKFRFYSPRLPIDDLADPFDVMTANARQVVWTNTAQRDREHYRELVAWQRFRAERLRRFKLWGFLFVCVLVSLFLIYTIRSS